MRKIIFAFCLVVTAITTYAHVGSPDVVMQANAGAYKLLVSITPPDVIPGVAKVKVYLQSGNILSISLRAVYYRSGDEGAPDADPMIAVEGQPNQYNGEIWLMSGGSSSVQLSITGQQGNAALVVPVVAISTAKKEMPAATGWILAALGIFLFVLMVTIIGASVSDAVTKTGEAIPAGGRKLRIAGMGVAALFTSLIVYGGNAWWQAWADDYNKYMFKPTQATSTIKNVDSANEMIFKLDTSSQRKTSFSYIIPDHGKMMHMFVMRLPAMDAFAHLHPERLDSATFRTILPGLPKGKYLAFGDVVYTSGYTETIKDTFEITSDLSNNLRKVDADDAFAYAIPADVLDNPQLIDPANTIVCGKPGTGVKLKDGSTMVWEGMNSKPLQAGQLYNLQFAVIGADKQPAVLQPYLGMAGHAAIVRNDGNVYIHLHPVGTYSMAAENNFVKRIAEPGGVYRFPEPKRFRDSISQQLKYLNSLSEPEKDSVLMQQMNTTAVGSTQMQGMQHNNTLSFPYSFPSPGQYRIWVQVKRNGQILTAAFDKVVE